VTAENPLAAIIPYCSSYTDRIYNPSITWEYSSWTDRGNYKTVPLYSKMFSHVITPYTALSDPATEPDYNPPPDWLRHEKIVP